MKLLIIEDDPILRKSLSQDIKQSGYEVTAFNNAVDALESYKKTFYPLILLDLALPGMDGFEMCREIRQLPKGKDSIIIVETGILEPEKITLVLDAGADDYIYKPIDPDFLHLRLKIAENHYRHRKKRRKAEQELTIQKEHLEVLTEAMHEMNLDLIEKEKMLIELNAAKDKFFNILAHDIKNPLTSIVGFTQILKQYFYDFNDIQKEEMIEDIDESAQILIRLIKDLLDWSRYQRGKITYNPQNIILRYLVSDEIAILLPSANGKNISLIHHIPESIVVYGDQYMVTTIVRNLLSNAIKFTPRGGKVSVTAQEFDNVVEIAIKDNGIGIKKENIDKLFRMDVHFSTQGTGEEQGTGMGLILCKDFVEKNKGKIWVESILGEGSTFKFTLPIGKEKTNAKTS